MKRFFKGFRTKTLKCGVMGLGALLVLVSVSCTSSPQFKGATLTTPAPDFRLNDQAGNAVALGDLHGNVVALTFLYTQCRDICPVIAAKLSQVYTALGDTTKNVRFVAVSVAPEVDTPNSIRAFSEKFGMQDKWLYLTGTRTQLAPVWSNYYLYVGELGAPTEPIEHQSRLLLIDRSGQERINFDTDFAVDDVVHDIKLLVND